MIQKGTLYFDKNLKNVFAYHISKLTSLFFLLRKISSRFLLNQPIKFVYDCEQREKLKKPWKLSNNE